jgi:hypothetical protein
MSQGYIKHHYIDYEERKVDRNLTPREKKLLEQNPNLDCNKIKDLKQKNIDYEVHSKKSQAQDFNFNTPNSSVYNKVNMNNSNIFHFEV